VLLLHAPAFDGGELHVPQGVAQSQALDRMLAARVRLAHDVAIGIRPTRSRHGTREKKGESLSGLTERATFFDEQGELDVLKLKAKSFLYRQHRLECLSGPQFIHRECADGIHQHRVRDAKIGVVLDCPTRWFCFSGFWIHIEC